MQPEPLFRALSDSTRLRCLALLAEHSELCVCELTHALALPQPKISHHLGGLRKVGLVCDRKEGLWIYYRINPELPQWVDSILKATVTGVGQREPFASDAQALSEMPNRPGGVCSA
ncbi:MAG: metalloregulator ArsR/SmtB family transcription factor [Sedimenticola sp.]|nr:metalloregulator ArsR/SmtB family transcription factor [Sedimenticola sp.]